MKHRSITHTVTPIGYISDPKKQTAQFNKWAKYISKEVKRIERKN